MGFYFLSHLNWLVHFRLSRCMLFFVVSIIEFGLVTLTACMFFSFFLLQRQSTLQILTSGSGTPAKTIHYFVSHITLFLIFRSILQFFFSTILLRLPMLDCLFYGCSWLNVGHNNTQLFFPHFFLLPESLVKYQAEVILSNIGLILAWFYKSFCISNEQIPVWYWLMSLWD